MKTRSSENLVDHVSVNVRQSAVDAVVANGETLVVDAEKMEDRRVKIVGPDRIDRLPGPIVATTVRDAAADAGAPREPG